MTPFALYVLGGGFMYLAGGCALAGLWVQPGALIEPDGRRRDPWGKATWALIIIGWPAFVILWSVNTWRNGR